MIVRGVELALHPSPDYVSDTIRERGDFYEAAILDEMRRRLEQRPPGVVVDAGAMIGNHTAYLAVFAPHTAIHAWEPARENLDLLRRNVALYPSVTVHPFALSDRQGVALLEVDDLNRGHAVIGPTGRPVATVTLDSLGLEDVALLKIDVEGHEPEVLAGARETINRSRPLIVIEDWARAYGELLPGYRLAAGWERAHQTFLYEPHA